jgi:hypothetical protein
MSATARHDLLQAGLGLAGGGDHGVIASLVAIGGLVCVFAWVGYRFGPTLLRYVGLAAWWAGWACGSQGGYTYMLALLILGSVSWALGTRWYHARRGRWPSPISRRLFTRTRPPESSSRR